MNLLVTGAWGGAKANIELLEEMGHSVCFMQFEGDELPCDYGWVEGVICNALFLHHPIEKFSDLRYIQLTSAGFDRVPMDYVTEKKIEIYNAKGVYSIPMAEFAVAGVLFLYKQMRFFEEKRESYSWEKHRGLLELYGKKVCILGCGSVGNECAKRFNAFGCEVTGIDLVQREDENYTEIYPLSQLNAQLKAADIVVLTLPLTEKTKNLLSQEQMRLLKSNAVIVNIARGGIIDTNALIETLPRIGGAVLDVFEQEPLCEKSPLWSMENVVITPHNSFIGNGNEKRLNEVIFKNIKGRKV